MFLTILKYSIGSLCWGFLITAALMALLVFLVSCFKSDNAFRPLSWVVCGVLSLILLWNTTLVCGAMALKSDIHDVEVFLVTCVGKYGATVDDAAAQARQSELVADALAEYPVVGRFVDSASLQVSSVAELPAAICGSLRSSLNSYITGKCLWSAAFMAVGGVLLGISMGGRRASRRRMDREDRYERFDRSRC